MTTAFSSSKILSLTRKYYFENKKLSLYSPVTLLGLLVIVFIFFLTASGGGRNARVSQRHADGHRVTIDNELAKPDSEILYRSVVKNGDAIRSVLQ